MKNIKPYIIAGEKIEDIRGSLSFVNGFDFANIKRFYILENSKEHPERGWIAHKEDIKHFYCLKGAFEIYYVKVDDFENPSKNLKIQKSILDENCHNLLVVPNGFATLLKSIREGSQLLNFSPLTLIETSNETVRYDLNMWKIEK